MGNKLQEWRQEYAKNRERTYNLFHKYLDEGKTSTQATMRIASDEGTSVAAVYQKIAKYKKDHNL